MEDKSASNHSDQTANDKVMCIKLSIYMLSLSQITDIGTVDVMSRQ